MHAAKYVRSRIFFHAQSSANFSNGKIITFRTRMPVVCKLAEYITLVDFILRAFRITRAISIFMMYEYVL